MKLRRRASASSIRTALLCALLASTCTGVLAMEPSKISGCPDTPNCVSSRTEDESRRVRPFPLDVSPEAAFALIKRALAAEPRTRIVEEREELGYLRAESTSLIFRFVDDVELQVDGEQRVVHVRSASRVGYWDLGVNRRRVERLRAALMNLGLWR